MKEVDFFMKYYWDKSVNGSLEKEMLCFSSINYLYIATAYISLKGIKLVKKMIEVYHLKRDNIIIYLSNEFSLDQPHVILKELVEISKVYIVENKLLHAKVYFFKGENAHLIFGSSNLTSGGFKSNLEFNCIHYPTIEEEQNIKCFFDYCKENADEVSCSLIKYYEDLSKELRDYRKMESKMKIKLKGFKKQNDEFLEDKYELDDFFFKYEDYETFFKRNSSMNNDRLSNVRRENVQRKLKDIHIKVMNEIHKLNLWEHWHPNNLTSLIYPNLTNKNRVNWMGVRYGKGEVEIKKGHLFGERDSLESFSKHACLQYNINSLSFGICLFFAVPNESIDRDYLYGKGLEILNEQKVKINSYVETLMGYGFKWIIENEDENNTQFIYDIDGKNAEKDLCAFLQKYDREGFYSYMSLNYEPSDMRIKTIDNICEEVINKFKLLKPLYDLIVYRPS